MLSITTQFAFAQTQQELEQLERQVEQARQQGDMDQADRLAAQYILLAEQQGSAIAKANANYQIGQNAMERNLYPLAQKHFNQAINDYMVQGDQVSLGQTYRQLGLTYRYQANYPSALEYIYQALQISQQQEKPRDMSSSYNAIGVVLEKMGLYEEAIQAHQQAMDINYQLGDTGGIASGLYNLADIRKSMGDYDEALRYFYDALELDIAAGNPKDIAYSHNKIGFLLATTGDYNKSREHLEQALTLFRKIQAPRDIDWALSSLAKLEVEVGNLEQAEKLIKGVIQRAIDNGYKSLLVDAYQVAAEMAIKQQDYQKALIYIDAGLKQAKEINERDQESFFEEQRVEVFVATDSIKQAFEALQRQKTIDNSIFNEKRADAIARVQAKTEFVRRAHQIELLEKEQALQQAIASQHNLNRNFLLISMLAAGVVIFLSYKRMLQKRLNQQLSNQVKQRTRELEVKHLELKKAYQEIEAISLTDKLTGLKNRRFLENQIENDIEQCRRTYQNWWRGKITQPKQSDIVFFIFDLDNFKQVNDQYGHNAGDKVLIEFTNRMAKVFRHADYLIRWGGEEFVAIARNIDRQDATILASRMQQAVSQVPFELSKEQFSYQTCSIGFACYPPSIEQECLESTQDVTWQQLISLADACLYQVKQTGKNNWLGVNTINNCGIFNEEISQQRLQLLIEDDLITLFQPKA